MASQNFDIEKINRGMRQIDREKEIIKEVLPHMIRTDLNRIVGGRMKGSNPLAAMQNEKLLEFTQNGNTLSVYGRMENDSFFGHIHLSNNRSGTHHLIAGWESKEGEPAQNIFADAGNLGGDALAVCISLLNELGQMLVDQERSVLRQTAARFYRAAERA
jgi:hypothetical protein